LSEIVSLLDASIAMAPQRKSFPRIFLARAEPFRLAGERVLLRSPERGDYEDWASLRGRSRDFLAPWEPSWPVDALSRASFRARIARYAEDWRTDQAYNLFIFTHDERLVGGVGLSNLRRGVSETASLGYWIGEPFSRQGYMTAALPLVLSFAFDRLRLHRVEAACLPNNAPSRALLVRAGFRQEGYARQYLCIEGRWQDHLLFAVLREDWEGRRLERASTTIRA
jgi:ribosomal-protein-alanine N-acetyltransferase